MSWVVHIMLPYIQTNQKVHILFYQSPDSQTTEHRCELYQPTFESNDKEKCNLKRQITLGFAGQAALSLMCLVASLRSVGQAGSTAGCAQPT